MELMDRFHCHLITVIDYYKKDWNLTGEIHV